MNRVASYIGYSSAGLDQVTQIMRYDGRFDIDDDGRALAALSFDPSTADQAHLCELFALVTLRLISNLKGRSESILIATDCKKPIRDLSRSFDPATKSSIARRRKNRHFLFSCTIGDSGAEFFDFQAKGFGFLAKGVGNAARSAVSGLRKQLVDSVQDADFHRKLDLVCTELCDIGMSGILTLSNQGPLGHRVVADVFGNCDTTRDHAPAHHDVLSEPPIDTKQICADLAKHRLEFGLSVGLSILDDNRDTALRCLQINAVTELIERWINNPRLKARVSEALRTVVQDGDPQACSTLTLKLADHASTQQDAECAIASMFFEDFGDDTDEAQRFMHELLILRMRTTCSIAAFLDDGELEKALSDNLAKALSTLPRYIQSEDTAVEATVVHQENSEEERYGQNQVTVARMKPFDLHRKQFYESIDLNCPSEHHRTALCALQVHIMMSVMGHWQYMLEAMNDCKEVAHYITQQGSPSSESCVALCQAMGEHDYDLLQAEQFIGNEFFVAKGVPPAKQRALSAAFLRFRYETLLATAELARDERVAEMIRIDKQRAEDFLANHGE